MIEKNCTHACYIYDDEIQRDKVISKFIKAGFIKGEKVAYFTDNKDPDEVIDWLINMGIKIPKDNNNEQFSITYAQNTYCPNKKFTPDEMLDYLRTFYQKVLNEGYSGVWISGEMSWALRGILGSERLMEYEALVNNVLQNRSITAICQYDARRFDGVAILNVLKVHPMIIVHGQIVQNPYFMNPKEFLKASYR